MFHLFYKAKKNELKHVSFFSFSFCTFPNSIIVFHHQCNLLIVALVGDDVVNAVKHGVAEVTEVGIGVGDVQFS